MCLLSRQFTRGQVVITSVVVYCCVVLTARERLGSTVKKCKILRFLNYNFVLDQNSKTYRQLSMKEMKNFFAFSKTGGLNGGKFHQTTKCCLNSRIKCPLMIQVMVFQSLIQKNGSLPTGRVTMEKFMLQQARKNANTEVLENIENITIKYLSPYLV